MATMQRAEGWKGRRRGSGMALVVLAIHLLFALALWQALRTREVDVVPDRAALVWLQPPEAQPEPPAKVAPPSPTKRSQPRPVAPPAPVTAPPHESTWVQPAPVAAAPAASAASEPPLERLLDTEATRMAIRQSARQPLLHERAAQAMGEDIGRSDTAMAGGVASAGKPDCAKMQAPGGILGLPIMAAMVASGKCTTK
jgi:hypothetical protein